MIEKIKSLVEVLIYVDHPHLIEEAQRLIAMCNSCIDNPDVDPSLIMANVRGALESNPELNQVIIYLLEQLGSLNESAVEEEAGNMTDDMEEETVEETVEEEAGIDTEEEADITEEETPERDDFKIKELEDRLLQIDININKIKELETNDQLESLYLEELGKKYLIEQELKLLGKEESEDTVENSLASIFESKEHSVVGRLSLFESRKEFNKKYSYGKVKLNKLFESIYQDRLNQELDENEFVILDGDVVISKPKEANVIFIKDTGSIDETELNILTDETVRYVEADGLAGLVSGIDNQISSFSKDVYVVATKSGQYLAGDAIDTHIGDDPLMLDAMTIDGYEEAKLVADEYSDLFGIEFKPVKSIVAFDEVLKIGSVTDFETKFSLNEAHMIGGITMRKGSPVQLIQTGSTVNLYESISDSGNVIKFSEDKLFDSKITPISGEDFDILTLSHSNESSDFYDAYSKATSNGVEFEPNEKVVGNTLVFTLTLVKDGESFSMNEQIATLDDVELEYHLNNYKEYTLDDVKDFYNYSEKIKSFIDRAVGWEFDGIENGSIITNPTTSSNDLFKNITTGQKLKTTTAVFLNENSEVTEDSAGGENSMLFDANEVLTYSENHGVRLDGTDAWHDVPATLLKIAEEFDPTTLVVGDTYTISDAVSEVPAIFSSVTDVDGDLYYEFTTYNDDQLLLTDRDVRYNTKK